MQAVLSLEGNTEVRSMERAVLVYTTFPSVVEAEKVGNDLVSARLAACVNILPGMISTYRWQGAVERAEEAVMIVKTRASLAEAVRASVRATHPYDTPAIVVLPVESVDDRYFAWILNATAPEGDELASGSPHGPREYPFESRK
jgi:periplasmic divalent cation tolerance protein